MARANYQIENDNRFIFKISTEPKIYQMSVLDMSTEFVTEFLFSKLFLINSQGSAPQYFSTSQNTLTDLHLIVSWT